MKNETVRVLSKKWITPTDKRKTFFIWIDNGILLREFFTKKECLDYIKKMGLSDGVYKE